MANAKNIKLKDKDVVLYPQTKTSLLLNDDGTSYDLTGKLAAKVDKDGSKVLSDNNYTTEEKNKLAGLNNYTLPKATKNTLGGVIIGDGLDVDNDGKVKVVEGTATMKMSETKDEDPTAKSLRNININGDSWNVAGESPIEINPTDEPTQPLNSIKADGVTYGSTVITFSVDTEEDPTATEAKVLEINGDKYKFTDKNFTVDKETKLNGIADNAEVNKIDKIKVNGTEQNISNKEVDITVPTKVGDLTNDSKFSSVIANPTNPGSTELIGLEIDGTKYKVPEAYTLPTATQDTLGGVKASAKADEDLQVAVDEDGKLWYKGGEGLPPITKVESLPQATEAEANKNLIYSAQNNLNYITSKIIPEVNCVNNLSYARESGQSEEPLNIYGSGVCNIGTDCYIFGGRIDFYSEIYSNAIIKYNTTANTFSRAGTLRDRDAMCESGLPKVCVVSNDCYYLSGGSTLYGPKIYLYKFDTLTGRLTRCDLNTAYRYCCPICSVNTDCYIFGGIDEQRTELSSILKYNTLTNEMIEVGNLPNSLSYSNACSIGTNCYVVGGIISNENKNNLNIFKFDTLTNQTTVVGTLPDAIDFDNICVNGTDCYIFGYSSDHSRSIFKFDTIVNKVTKLCDFLGIEKNAAIINIDSIFYSFGGEDNQQVDIGCSDINKLILTNNYDYAQLAKTDDITLPIASDTILGGVKAKSSTVEDTQEVHINESGELVTKPGLNQSEVDARIDLKIQSVLEEAL